MGADSWHGRGRPGVVREKRRDAQANAKLDEFKDQRKVATLPASRCSPSRERSQLPRFAVHVARR